MRRRRGFDPTVLVFALAFVIAVVLLFGHTLMVQFGWVHP